MRKKAINYSSLKKERKKVIRSEIYDIVITTILDLDQSTFVKFIEGKCNHDRKFWRAISEEVIDSY